MKMRYYGLFVLLVALCLVPGCGSSKEVSQSELKDYIRALAAVQKIQRKAVDEYNQYVNEDGLPDSSVLSVLNDSILPTYEEYVREVCNLAPENEVLKDVHEQCIKASETQRDALYSVRDALEHGSDEELEQALESVNVAREMFNEYESSISKIASSCGYTLVKAE